MTREGICPYITLLIWTLKFLTVEIKPNLKSLRIIQFLKLQLIRSKHVVHKCMRDNKTNSKRANPPVQFVNRQLPVKM